MTSKLIFLLLVLSFEDHSYLHSYFCFNISVEFLLILFLKGFCLIAQESFGCFLKMPINLAHYRVTVGIFNNCEIIISLHYEGSLYLVTSNNLSNYGSYSYSSLIVYFFFYVLCLSNGNVQKITIKFCVQSFLFHNIAVCRLICLCS